MGQGPVEVARRFEDDPNGPGQAAKEADEAIIVLGVIGHPEVLGLPVATFPMSMATNQVCGVRVMSSAIVVPSSAPNVRTKGCCHTSYRPSFCRYYGTGFPLAPCPQLACRRHDPSLHQTALP